VTVVVLENLGAILDHVSGNFDVDDLTRFIACVLVAARRKGPSVHCEGLDAVWILDRFQRCSRVSLLPSWLALAVALAATLAPRVL
jgi:hypothetical protein